MLWQRSGAEKLAELVEAERERVDSDFPELNPPPVRPASELLPPGACWDRAIVLRGLEVLGHPPEKTEGVRAAPSVRGDGIQLEITHTPEAVAAFEARFPELERMAGE